MADNLDPTSTAAEDCPSQDDGGVVNPDDAVLAVPADGAGQHRALNVGAKPDQIGGGVPVIDADDVPLDDGALVQVFGDVVGGGADQLDAGSRLRQGATLAVPQAGRLMARQQASAISSSCSPVSWPPLAASRTAGLSPSS